jgi:hypothetical protein
MALTLFEPGTVVKTVFPFLYEINNYIDMKKRIQLIIMPMFLLNW